MNDKKLHALLDDLSLKEKIGQLVQLLVSSLRCIQPRLDQNKN